MGCPQGKESAPCLNLSYLCVNWVLQSCKFIIELKQGPPLIMLLIMKLYNKHFRIMCTVTRKETILMLLNDFLQIIQSLQTELLNKSNFGWLSGWLAVWLAVWLAGWQSLSVGGGGWINIPIMWSNQLLLGYGWVGFWQYLITIKGNLLILLMFLAIVPLGFFYQAIS